QPVLRHQRPRRDEPLGDHPGGPGRSGDRVPGRRARRQQGLRRHQRGAGGVPAVTLSPLSIVRGALAALCCAAALAAQPLTPGNLLVSNGIYLYEYPPAGAQVRSVLVPHPTGGNALGDCVIDAAGWVHVLSLSRQEQDYLTSYDPVGGTWQQD